jgi:hypothetical protein
MFVCHIFGFFFCGWFRVFVNKDETINKQTHIPNSHSLIQNSFYVQSSFRQSNTQYKNKKITMSDKKIQTTNNNHPPQAFIPRTNVSIETIEMTDPGVEDLDLQQVDSKSQLKSVYEDFNRKVDSLYQNLYQQIGQSQTTVDVLQQEKEKLDYETCMLTEHIQRLRTDIQS